MKKKINKKCPNREESKCPKEKGTCPTSQSFENSGGNITDNEYEITSENEEEKEKEED